MGFEFKLEALRRYRNFQEEMVQKELSIAQRNLNQEIDFLEELLDKRTRTENYLKEEQKRETNGTSMALYDSYLKRISKEISAHRIRVEEAQEVYNKIMADLLEAMQKRKSIDKLKEKDLKNYTEILNQNEQKFINEIAINQFIRDKD